MPAQGNGSPAETCLLSFKKDASNSKRAAKYIQHTMEDAQFFNNRLRMMEISNILPVIASANQQAAEKSRTRFLFGLIGVSVALIIILILSFVNNRQKNKLKKNKQEIEEQNEKQKEMNAQLTQLNQQLDRNKHQARDLHATLHGHQCCIYQQVVRLS